MKIDLLGIQKCLMKDFLKIRKLTECQILNYVSAKCFNLQVQK